MSPPPPRLVVSVDRAVVPVLHLDGILDQRTTPLLRAEAARVLVDQPQDVVLECRGLLDVDAAGLRTLLDIRRHLPHPGELLVVGASDTLRELLRVTALDQSVHVIAPGHAEAAGDTAGADPTRV
ncbi:MAG TPA: STAS domain-containing protein [Acidimicrobiales bacterium]|nr:STAS domain-containing protein [Acidimicrobiales bacterium]